MTDKRAALEALDILDGAQHSDDQKTGRVWIIEDSEYQTIRAVLQQNAELQQQAYNVILSWKHGDVTTTGTALLELENGLEKYKVKS